MATARERQVAWELGRRDRQVGAELAGAAFCVHVRYAVPVHNKGRSEAYTVRGRPVVVVPGRAFLVALRHRYSLAWAMPWAVAWSEAEPVIDSLAFAMSVLENRYRSRGGINLDSDRDVAEWVITQAVHEAIRDGVCRPE